MADLVVAGVLLLITAPLMFLAVDDLARGSWPSFLFQRRSGWLGREPLLNGDELVNVRLTSRVDQAR